MLLYIAIKGLQFINSKDVVHVCIRRLLKELHVHAHSLRVFRLRSMQKFTVRNPIYGNQQTVYMTVQVLP